MCPQIGHLAQLPDYANQAGLAGSPINRVVAVDVVFDFINSRFSRYAPFFTQIPNMSDVFVRALMVRLVDTGYVSRCHMLLLSFVATDIPGFIDFYGNSTGPLDTERLKGNPEVLTARCLSTRASTSKRVVAFWRNLARLDAEIV